MLLALDTSGPFCSAALLDDDGNVVAFKSENIVRGHAERLMPMVSEIRENAGIVWEDVTRIAVATGPGSFTGLRVGLAAARGLALARKIPCHGVSVFEAFKRHFDEPLTVAMDARRGEIWLCDDAGPRAVTVTDALTLIAPDTKLAGSAAPLLQQGGLSLDVLSDAPSPPIEAVGLCALEQDQAQPATPLYLRAPDAKPQKPLQEVG